MRLAVGGFVHESNTFRRPFTSLADFERARLDVGTAMLRNPVPEIDGILRAADDLGFVVAPTYYAEAPSGGPLADDCFRTLLERLMHAIEAAQAEQSVDGVLLCLHGSLVTETDDDADGTILAEVRSCLPPGVPLIVTFAARANLSPLMVSTCDALIGGCSSSRLGLRDSGYEAAVLLVRMLREELRPALALAKPPLLPSVAASVQEQEEEGPLLELLTLARAAEQQPGVVRVCVAAGFPCADIPRAGLGILVVTDGDGEQAAEVAEDLAEAAWDRRAALVTEVPNAEAAAGCTGDARTRHYENVRRPLYPLDLW